jgi:hypothetical protein
LSLATTPDRSRLILGAVRTTAETPLISGVFAVPKDPIMTDWEGSAVTGTLAALECRRDAIKAAAEAMLLEARAEGRLAHRRGFACPARSAAAPAFLPVDNAPINAAGILTDVDSQQVVGRMHGPADRDRSEPAREFGHR